MRCVEESWFFRILGWICIILSFAGVVFAAMISGNIADGQRGGAIADVLALLALFGTRNHSADTYDALTRRSPERKDRIIKLSVKRNTETYSEPPVGDPLEIKMLALEKRLNLDAEGQKIQNFWLAISTFFGTVFWGFGDIFAGWFMR